MCRDYYTLQFMDPSVDTQPIAPALQAFFDDVLDASVAELNFKAIVDGLGEVLFQYPFRWVAAGGGWLGSERREVAQGAGGWLQSSG
jgi:predicted unusual protein kinase regulating ubiquinone biosynthesis (AarF/ABC1/UbiB family)